MATLFLHIRNSSSEMLRLLKFNMQKSWQQKFEHR